MFFSRSVCRAFFKLKFFVVHNISYLYSVCELSEIFSDYLSIFLCYSDSEAFMCCSCSWLFLSYNEYTDGILLKYSFS